MPSTASRALIAIACGGTGGHLFPGLAIGEALLDHGCDVMLLISPKEVDQEAVRAARGFQIETLPAVGFERGRLAAFARGCWQSYGQVRRIFQARAPAAVLSMGGFTSAPPVLAGRNLGAAAFLHESNSIPGRANRWLAHVVEEAFVYFAEASGRLWHQKIAVTGMPVRTQFLDLDAGACRMALGLDPARPVLLSTGGSQGASGLNSLILRALPSLALLEPELQYIHLTGKTDIETVRAAYAGLGRKAVVFPFLTEMELALGAATVAVSRAGASSLAELAALRLPSLLVPYPAAADNHQWFNARAFRESGAARMQEQSSATAESFLWEIRALLREELVRQRMGEALAVWHYPTAAQTIAQRILDRLPVIPVPSPAEPVAAAFPRLRQEMLSGAPKG